MHVLFVHYLSIFFFYNTLGGICIIRRRAAVKCVRCRLLPLPSPILRMGSSSWCCWCCFGGGGCCSVPQRTRTASPVCVCVCVNVLCLVSFHFRFTFSLFALLLPAFIVELYSCRFHFILLYFTFFILSNLHFSPGCGLFFWQGWFPLTYINTYMNVCRTCNGVSYAPDFDPFPGGWDLRRLATHPSAVTLGKVSCK